jgi:hypothetical protein
MRRVRMQATLTRPRATKSPFYAHTGVPLGPLPMHSPDPEELVPYHTLDGSELSVEGFIDVEVIIAAHFPL